MKMGKSTKQSSSRKSAPTVSSQSESATFDPTLATLFASSAGPVTVPQRPTKIQEKIASNGVTTDSSLLPTVSTETSSDEKSEVSSNDRDESGSEAAAEPEELGDRPRKRRKVDWNEDLESEYLDKLAREEEEDLKLRTKQTNVEAGLEDEPVADGSDSDSDLNSNLQDISDSDADGSHVETEEDAPPQHESLTNGAYDLEAEKIKRTVFLGNVSTSCIRSKSAKTSLMQHLQSALNKEKEKIESIRFRSTAFVSDAGPKKAAYAKKELMDETTKSTNAYVVLSSEAAARSIASRLNGTVVLDRHLRADYLGRPAPVEHRRCVFVGNLSFVDEATAPDTDQSGEKHRKRAKDPADVEEGLWRTFEKCGKVESVRVVRDKETRISKGFAYVQFESENSVERALLMEGKKFPPMLPRLLRVSRAKREMKKDRRGKMAGISSRTGQSRPPVGMVGAPSGQKVVFEGHRASSSSMPKGLKKLKKRPAVKPSNRSSKRGAAFKANRGKKRRDVAG